MSGISSSLSPPTYSLVHTKGLANKHMHKHEKTHMLEHYSWRCIDSGLAPSVLASCWNLVVMLTRGEVLSGTVQSWGSVGRHSTDCETTDTGHNLEQGSRSEKDPEIMMQCILYLFWPWLCCIHRDLYHRQAISGRWWCPKLSSSDKHDLNLMRIKSSVEERMWCCAQHWDTSLQSQMSSFSLSHFPVGSLRLLFSLL